MVVYGIWVNNGLNFSKLNNFKFYFSYLKSGKNLNNGNDMVREWKVERKLMEFVLRFTYQNYTVPFQQWICYLQPPAPFDQELHQQRIEGWGWNSLKLPEIDEKENKEQEIKIKENKFIIGFHRKG